MLKAWLVGIENNEKASKSRSDSNIPITIVILLTYPLLTHLKPKINSNVIIGPLHLEINRNRILTCYQIELNLMMLSDGGYGKD